MFCVLVGENILTKWKWEMEGKGLVKEKNTMIEIPVIKKAFEPETSREKKKVSISYEIARC